MFDMHENIIVCLNFILLFIYYFNVRTLRVYCYIFYVIEDYC